MTFIRPPASPTCWAGPSATAAAELGLAADLKVSAARSYLIQADWDRRQAERVALELLTDTIVERAIVAQVGDAGLKTSGTRAGEADGS